MSLALPSHTLPQTRLLKTASQKHINWYLINTKRTAGEFRVGGDVQTKNREKAKAGEIQKRWSNIQSKDLENGDR